MRKQLISITTVVLTVASIMALVLSAGAEFIGPGL
jgi:preprotein translocase subunit SecE